MTIENYKAELLALNSNEEKIAFIQKHFFFGLPVVFAAREHEYYSFRKRIADNFGIDFNDVLIVGSSKFGFSPYKFTEFSLDSDIDVVITDEKLFEYYYELICDYQYQIKLGRIRLTTDQFSYYSKFLRYMAMGWMRPDLLPRNTLEFKALKQQWDEFFHSISYSKSEVGNYSVKGGLFKGRKYAEKYYRSSLDPISLAIKSIT